MDVRVRKTSTTKFAPTPASGGSVCQELHWIFRRADIDAERFFFSTWTEDARSAASDFACLPAYAGLGLAPTGGQAGGSKVGSLFTSADGSKVLWCRDKVGTERK